MKGKIDVQIQQLAYRYKPAAACGAQKIREAKRLATATTGLHSHEPEGK
ncbi:hypothetical protein [Pontibacter burrus]|uniref:Uncharacterized protein n=1 Tax=Pontibacter burrus TaxID=2704466 RepID=A0A6B3LTE8_9BACT|nr:hypothetical protein [Pontibacter burrus]NEM97288.1 hypothetical protein [Pontibacter burrus]